MNDTGCFLVYDHYELNNKRFMVLACFRQDDRKLLYIRYFATEEKSVAGNVYVARIEKRVQNVGVFLTIPDGHVFVRDKDCRDPFYVKKQSFKKNFSVGDLILVQIEKDAIKTKEPEGKLSISIKTPYFILEKPGNEVSFSKRLQAKTKEKFSDIKCRDKSLLIRTAAAGIEPDELQKRIDSSSAEIDEIFSNGKNHTEPTLVWQDDDLLNRLLSAFPFARNHMKVTRIRTSDRNICDSLGEYGELYNDDGLSLLDLYRIRTITDNLLKKTVWLKSGGNIVIEQTEALTVIDVNSAKSKRCRPFTVNKEAATTIMEEIRLRNLSGIIVIDFMKMHSDDEKDAICSLMRAYADRDFARTSIEGFTRLGLLEMTREKLFPSVNQTLTGHLNYGTISSVDAQ